MANRVVHTKPMPRDMPVESQRVYPYDCLPRIHKTPSRHGMAEVGGISGGQLRSLVERIERLEEERGAIANDIREVYAEGKAAGFDLKIMRQVLRLRKMEKADRDEQGTLLDLYMHAIGMQDATPVE